MQGIEIPIGAPLGKLNQDLDGAQKALKGFTVAANGDLLSIGKSLGTLERQLKVFKDGIKNSTDPGRILLLNNAIKATEAQLVGTKNAINGVGFNKFSTGSNQAAFALQNLGRVAQDAPFGFIGIQNNIAPLLESFQRLKQDSGSTQGALKSLASSLVGGGGLLLAVSLVTSALTVLAQNPEKVAGALNYLSGVVDNATENQKKYNEALIDAQGGAKLEISTLESLIGIAKNETLSRNARLEALKAVKAEYPEQLNFLTLETVGSKEAAKAIDLLSDSLLRKAKIQAAEKLLGEAFVKQLQATTKTAVEQASTFSKVVGVALGAAGIKNFVVLQDGLNNQTKAFKEAGSEIDTYTQILNNLRTEEAKTGNLFDDKQGKGSSLLDLTKQLKAAKLDNYLQGLDIAFRLAGQGLESFKKSFPKDTKKTFSSLTDKPLIDINKLLDTKTFIPDNLGEKLYTPFQVLQDNIKFDLLPQLGSSFKTFFDDILMNGNFSFSALGQAIKNTFLSVLASEATQGVLKLLGSAGGKTEKGGGLIAGIAGLFGASKKAAPLAGIAASTGGFLGSAATIGAPVAAASPLLPILAGVAAIAGIASLFKKKQQAPIPQASSTISTSAAGSAQDFGGGRVVFEISGTNLIGVLNRAGAKLQRFGP
jgi:hypothetical protein